MTGGRKARKRPHLEDLDHVAESRSLGKQQPASPCRLPAEAGVATSWWLSLAYLWLKGAPFRALARFFPGCLLLLVAFWAITSDVDSQLNLVAALLLAPYVSLLAAELRRGA